MLLECLLLNMPGQNNPYTPPSTDVTKSKDVEKLEDEGPDYFWRIYIFGVVIVVGFIALLLAAS